MAEVKNTMDYENQRYKLTQSLFKVELGEISFSTFISLMNCDLEHLRGSQKRRRVSFHFPLAFSFVCSLLCQ